MSDSHTPAGVNRNLLLGILALQVDFVSREKFVEATRAWLKDKSRNLDEVLVEQGVLKPSMRDLLLPIVQQHIEDHGGDPTKSLAALSTVGSVADDLRSLSDEQIDATLSLAGQGHNRNAIEPTIAPTIHRVSSGAVADHDFGRDWAVDRFRILRPHAKGGLGEVSLAKDLELNRDVALKQIQSRFADDETSRSRFLLEAEVTGGLEHPGIVPVYGLGRYQDGRPFYAMRFIKGDSLQEAADHFHAETVHDSIDFSGVEFRKLLGRFVDVCQAIEYAHSRGVLHRDLKPGNIMLGKYGETLVVDWGLAKTQETNDLETPTEEAPLRPTSASGSAATIMGNAIGTPAFMPPEQAAGRLDELGPPSDVYSLGATLYYVLTGESPFSGNDVRDLLEKVKTGQFLPPRDVCPQVPRPLDAICRRAMATEPADRYQSPREFAEDVECYLADEPVTALRESLGARIRRWLRKHPRSVAAVATTMLAGLVSVCAIAGVVSHNAEIVAGQNEELRLANEAERTAKEDAVVVTDFFANSVFARARPKNQVGGLGVDTTIRDAIDVAEVEIALSFSGRPLVEARIRHTLGDTYAYLGEYNPAIAQLERARDLYVSELGPTHENSLEVKTSLANAYTAAGLHSKSLPVYRETLELSRKTLGPGHKLSLALMGNIAGAIYETGRHREAMSLMEQTVQLQKKHQGTEHRDTLTGTNTLAYWYLNADRLAQALSMAKEIVQVQQRVLGPDDPETLRAMDNLASAYQKAEQLDEAVPLFEQLLDIRKANFGPEHPITLEAMNNLALAYSDLDRQDEAVALLEQSLQLLQEKLDRRNPKTVTAMHNLVQVYLSVGRHDDALSLAEETLTLARKEFDSQHPATALALNAVANVYDRVGRFREALQLREQILNLRKAIHGPQHSLTLLSINQLAHAYEAAGRLDRSIPLFQESLRLAEATFGPGHPETLVTMIHLARQLMLANRPQEAFPNAQQALAVSREKLGADHRVTLTCMDSLATAYQNTGQLDRALELFEETLQLRTVNLGPDHEDALESLNNLGVCCWRMGKLDRSLPLFQQLAEARERKYGKDHPAALQTRANLGVNLCDSGQVEEGIPLLEDVYRKRHAHASLNWVVDQLLDNYLKTERNKEAVTVLQDVIADAKRFMKPRSLELADELAYRASILIRLEAWSESEKPLRECLTICEQAGRDHWLWFYARSLLGEALSGQERPEEAEPLLVEGYRGLKAHVGEIPSIYDNHNLVADAIERLIRLYTGWEKPEDVAEWEAELQNWLSLAGGNGGGVTVP